MKRTLLFFAILLLPVWVFSQKGLKPIASGKLQFITTDQVLQDLKSQGKNSKYWETAQDLIYLDENLIGALNTLQADAVTQENIEMIRYIDARDQKPYREVWDHNILLKFEVSVTDIRTLFTDPSQLTELKKKTGREFNRLDAAVFTRGSDRVMFILRAPSSDAGSFYRAILTGNLLRIDEISNWRDE